LLGIEAPARASAVRGITIGERSKQDPSVGAKLGAKELFQRLLEGIKDSKGVQVEFILGKGHYE
jgi:hypothetical protein